MALRQKVLTIYKELLYMGKEYPLGYDYFRQRLKRAFDKNRGLSNEEKITEMLNRAEFVKKEIAALSSLRKYRAMKQRYYEEEPKSA